MLGKDKLHFFIYTVLVNRVKILKKKGLGTNQYLVFESYGKFPMVRR